MLNYLVRLHWLDADKTGDRRAIGQAMAAAVRSGMAE
jgi:hypothetical protein